MQQLYNCFLSSNCDHKDFSKKLSVMLNSVLKVEKICYSIILQLNS